MTSPLIRATAVTTAVVAASAFAISAAALTELGAAARLPIPWLLPVVLDGATVIASFALVALREHRAWLTRAWPALVILLSAALSVYANYLHSTGRQISEGEAGLIGAVPPTILCVSAHLLLLLISPQPKTTRIATSSATRARAKMAVRVPAPSPAAGVEARVLAHRAEHGAWPTGAQAAAFIGGVSSKTGVRLVNRVRAQEAANA